MWNSPSGFRSPVTGDLVGSVPKRGLPVRPPTRRPASGRSCRAAMAAAALTTATARWLWASCSSRACLPGTRPGGGARCGAGGARGRRLGCWCRSGYGLPAGISLGLRLGTRGQILAAQLGGDSAAPRRTKLHDVSLHGTIVRFHRAPLAVELRCVDQARDQHSLSYKHFTLPRLRVFAIAAGSGRLLRQYPQREGG